MSGFVKQEISDPSYEDADEEDETLSSSRDGRRSRGELQSSVFAGRSREDDILSKREGRMSTQEGRLIGQDVRMSGIEDKDGSGEEDMRKERGLNLTEKYKSDVGELSQRISALSQDGFRFVFKYKRNLAKKNG